MPEEINRVVVDHLSDVLLCPTQAAVANLAKEGITEGVHLVGDVMLDTARYFAERVDAASVLSAFGVTPGDYYLATVHRAATSDSPEHLESVVRAFGRLGKPVIWAVHPRTQANLERFGLDRLVETLSGVQAIPPLSYLDTVALLSESGGLLTDSGGMQKEAYFFGVPCVTLRDETEWVETVELGWNRLAGTNEDAIVAAAEELSRPAQRPPVYGDGHAAESVTAILEAKYTA
jgi:UDP-N-acetylglucosamine 2-epimerase